MKEETMVEMMLTAGGAAMLPLVGLVVVLLLVQVFARPKHR
jgi:hypothetical protein